MIAQGRVADGLAELRRMRDGPGVTSGERAVAGGWASIARLSLGDLDGAAATAALARDEAVAAGSHPTASLAVTALGLVTEVRAELAEALRLVDEGMRLAGLDPRREGYRDPLLVAPGATSSSGWTGWRRPGPPWTPAGPAASGTACAGRCPASRSGWPWSGSSPANGTTPWPS